MRKFSRLFLFLSLILVLLTAACGAEQGMTPTTIVGTLLPDLTGTPLGGITTAEATGTAGLGTPTSGLETATLESPTATATSQAAVVPVTGQDIVLVECQFCVDTRAHALIVLPDTATFKITSPAPSTTGTTADDAPACITVEVNNGRQVVLCSGPELTPLVVNICTDPNTCKDFPVDLLACPLTPGGAVGPAQTEPAPGTGGMTATPTATQGGVTISTATPAGTATPTSAP